MWAFMRSSDVGDKAPTGSVGVTGLRFLGSKPKADSFARVNVELVAWGRGLIRDLSKNFWLCGWLIFRSRRICFKNLRNMEAGVNSKWSRYQQQF